MPRTATGSEGHKNVTPEVAGVVEPAKVTITYFCHLEKFGCSAYAIQTWVYVGDLRNMMPPDCQKNAASLDG